MIKILLKYRDDMTLANAQKIRAYDRKHMMASCMLDKVERDIWAMAIRHANSGKKPD